MLRVAIIGEQCAGKTEAAKAIEKYAGKASIIKFAGPIYSTLQALGVEKDRRFMQEFSDLSKKHFGNDIFVRRFCESVESMKKLGCTGTLICDDVRYPAELKTCKALGFYTIYVGASEQVRRQRAKIQGLDFAENHSSETYVRSMKRMADEVIDNSMDNMKLFENRIGTVLRYKLAA